VYPSNRVRTANPVSFRVRDSGLLWLVPVLVLRRSPFRHSISTGDSICILALGSGERLLYPSNRVRTANPVSVRVRAMVSASLSSAAVESPVLIESPGF